MTAAAEASTPAADNVAGENFPMPTHQAATNALKQIDPEAAARAGVKSRWPVPPEPRPTNSNRKRRLAYA